MARRSKLIGSRRAPPILAQRRKIADSFARVVKEFAVDRSVEIGEGQGFGSGALKVGGKIFAMLTSRGRFVVKLPKERVNALVESGAGERFETSGGRVMKEWEAVTTGPASWLNVAQEACRFVKASADPKPAPRALISRPPPQTLKSG